MPVIVIDSAALLPLGSSSLTDLQSACSFQLTVSTSSVHRQCPRCDNAVLSNETLQRSAMIVSRLLVFSVEQEHALLSLYCISE